MVRAREGVYVVDAVGTGEDGGACDAWAERVHADQHVLCVCVCIFWGVWGQRAYCCDDGHYAARLFFGRDVRSAWPRGVPADVDDVGACGCGRGCGGECG